MPITVVPPSDDHDDDLPFVEESEDGTSYTFTELMRTLQSHSDIIITIPADQEASLRKGLVNRKTRDTVKLKSAGIVPDAHVLSFLSYPHKDTQDKSVPGWIDVRIKLAPRKGITVREIRIPSDSL